MEDVNVKLGVGLHQLKRYVTNKWDMFKANVNNKC